MPHHQGCSPEHLLLVLIVVRPSGSSLPLGLSVQSSPADNGAPVLEPPQPSHARLAEDLGVLLLGRPGGACVSFPDGEGPEPPISGVVTHGGKKVCNLPSRLLPLAPDLEGLDPVSWRPQPHTSRISAVPASVC